ncbi:hypothetical protein LTR53_008423 [Teratosphaeriaceae sp. CCFEE 6253]|nr:hypothetical protein LTR53_008423 [Teratosphaeriaceae sp. CCFEE 6253]
MSGLLRPRYFAAGAGVGALLYMFPIGSSNVFETPAVKAIGDRHSAGGGSTTHTTGVATKLGMPRHIARGGNMANADVLPDR